MNSFPNHGKEKYFSPETEIIPISIEIPMLQGGSGETIIDDGGGDIGWPTSNPTSNQNYHG